MVVYLQQHKWIRFLIPCMVSLSLFLGLYHMMTVEGADNNPNFVMIRLEDIGPGGTYSSIESLGKLRAVFEYLQQKQVPYSMAVIPRWINYTKEGKYDRSLAQLDDEYTQSFARVLQQAVQAGATLGMHGYTHQVGDTLREDGQQASAIGNEFNVQEVKETTTASFAEQRVKEGIQVFHQAGLFPHFWEAPHYRSTPEQDQIFSSYFGLIYQPHLAVKPNLLSADYFNEPNQGFGVNTLGTVFVPAPLSYVPANKDEKVIVNQIGKKDRINSFFYHPFLEFSQLIPVVDASGVAIMRDGVPVYKYPEENKSNLQKLIAQIKAKEYSFYSIHDYIPFTPATRVKVGNGKAANVQIGDVTGRGQADLVMWDRKSGNVSVIEGNFKERLRNEPQSAPKMWTTIPGAEGTSFTLNSTNGDGRNGLWVVYPSGKLESYASNGSQFILNHKWTIPTNRWLDAYELKQPNGDCVIAGQSQDRKQLLAVYVHNGIAKPIKPYQFKSNTARELIVRKQNKEGKMNFFLSKRDTSQGVELEFDRANMQWKLKPLTFNIPAELGEIRFGDFNGDGREDILRWDAKNLTNRVYQQTDDDEYKLLSVFGPWGKSGSRLILADFDANGKKDIGLIQNGDGNMDIALSYQSKEDK
ncbi:DUF2334 domain-containing protein [Paenibacillus sp. SYP-B3998]|uniref:DUF2334 domain-containing protein n=1 Tax=Paenibacillus sp. SYP-B3998 TaxID=2678564 RepID=A0A6G3ZWS3_9BACL|nr:DUF2334 domain-containing protein [Paenibacillus sp. SYP-B3998]NEW06663.1 DUF2334 domain-containing protein [Paenibacillus sp. SYP-B3998]